MLSDWHILFSHKLYNQWHWIIVWMFVWWSPVKFVLLSEYLESKMTITMYTNIRNPRWPSPCMQISGIQDGHHHVYKYQESKMAITMYTNIRNPKWPSPYMQISGIQNGHHHICKYQESKMAITMYEIIRNPRWPSPCMKLSGIQDGHHHVWNVFNIGIY